MTISSNAEAILRSLNAQQREAVTTIDGPLMTLAGPGSGKTRVVTHRIAYMIDQGIPSNSILAMTFTNKAAQTIRERISALVGSVHVTMGTFHGFGARFLRRHGASIGLRDNFSIYDTDDSKRALQRAVKLAEVELTHVSLPQLTREISRLKNNLVTPEMLPDQQLGIFQTILEDVYPVYQRILLESAAVDFDDLLLYPAVILRNEPSLRAELDQRYEYILVDEYQDTNFAQYMLVRALSIDKQNVNVTGDPDQSIYGWRGANIENILSFERDYPGAKIVRLEQNYRSTPEILSAADDLISRNKRRKAKNLIAVRESGVKVRLVNYASDREEANHIADQIQTAITEMGENPRDFAVLYRTNAQSRLFEQALLSRRINYQLIGGFKFYHRQEIKDLVAYLRLVQNARDDVAFTRVINTPTRGLGDKTIAKIQELAESNRISLLEGLLRAVESEMLPKKAAAGAESFLRLYGELVTLSRGKLVDLISHLLDRTDYLAYLAKQKAAEPDESVDENVNELLADAKQFDLEYGDSEGEPLSQFLEQIALMADADQVEEDPDRVTLMTLHSAKGLEFPSVFLVAVEHDLLPHARSKDDPAQLEEERRLFFVGITRAKDRLQLSTANRRGFQGRTSVPSPFLFEVPRVEMEVVDLADSRGLDDFDHDPFGDSDSEDLDDFQPFGDDDHSEGAGFDADKIAQPRAKRSKGYRTDSVELPKGLQAALSRIRKTKTATKASSKHVSSNPTAGFSSGCTTVGGVSVESFVEGKRAHHPNYGEGVIVSTEVVGSKRRAIVRFDQGDTKTFILSSSQLAVLN